MSVSRLCSSNLLHSVICSPVNEPITDNHMTDNQLSHVTPAMSPAVKLHPYICSQAPPYTVETSIHLYITQFIGQHLYSL